MVTFLVYNLEEEFMRGARLVVWTDGSGVKHKVPCLTQEQIKAAQSAAQLDGVTAQVKVAKAKGNGSGGRASAKPRPVRRQLAFRR
jgi:hypothetical protein